MADLNFLNRILGIMDNLTFLRAINSESIDLIAIDPPFAANETFEGRPKPPITDAERAEERALAARHGDDALARYQLEHKSLTSVKDDWFFRNVDPSWMAELREVSAAVKHYDRRIEEGERPADIGYPPTERERTLAAIVEVIEAVQAVATENEAAYIALMAVRSVRVQPGAEGRRAASTFTVTSTPTHTCGCSWTPSSGGKQLPSTRSVWCYPPDVRLQDAHQVLVFTGSMTRSLYYSKADESVRPSISSLYALKCEEYRQDISGRDAEWATL